MSKGITESVVEDTALDWLKALGYEVLSGLAIAPGEPAAARPDCKQVFLFNRLQTKLEDLNPKIPLEGLQDALLPKLLSGELRLPSQGFGTAGVPKLQD
jgi:type I restriction enzyme R subunit